MSDPQNDPRPIGVFDSGMGGMTVLRALRAKLPHENLLYLGDTARLPYGTKSAATVTTYAAQATGALVRRGVKMVVVACNTASSVALGALAQMLAPTPVIGVVEPGAAAACALSRNGHIAVIATEGTVRGGAYTRAIHAIRPEIAISQIACGLFVTLAEEGWTDGAVLEAAAHRYLDPVFSGASKPPDTLLLGCTHFPVLAPALATLLGAQTRLVDSAATTATAVAKELLKRNLANTDGAAGAENFMVTDSPERFVRVGPIFFGSPVPVRNVETIDL